MTKMLIQSVGLSLILMCLSLSTSAQEMLSQRLTPNVSIADTMTIDKFTQLMQQGFKSVIVHRPDEEIGNRVSVSALRDIAEKNRVGVIYQPIERNAISQKDIVEFAQYFNELPKPILMVCNSGSRSTLIYNKAKTQGLLNE